jgi:hypothetical protein
MASVVPSHDATLFREARVEAIMPRNGGRMYGRRRGSATIVAPLGWPQTPYKIVSVGMTKVP